MVVHVQLFLFVGLPGELIDTPNFQKKGHNFRLQLML